MEPVDDAAHAQYELAMGSLDRLFGTLPHPVTLPLVELFDELREQVRQAYWQARLGQRITRASIAATAYCRELTLGPNQRKYVDELRQGMLAAERSLTDRESGPPWNVLIYGRNQIPEGLPRNSYECGFIMRLYQLIQELTAQRPLSDEGRRLIAQRGRTLTPP